MPELDSPDLGDMLRANSAAAGMDLSSEAPLISGQLPDTPPTESDPFARMMAAGDKSEQPSPTPEQPEPQPLPKEAPKPSTAAMQALKDKYGVDYSTKYADDDAFYQGHLNLAKKLGERDEYANLGRLAQEQPEQVLALYKQHYPHLFEQQQQTREPEPTTTPTGGPQWKDKWNRYIERGQLVAETPDNVREEMATYYREKAVLESPSYQEVTKKLKDLEGRLAQQPQHDPSQAVDARLTQYEQKRLSAEWLNANRGWLLNEAGNGLTPDGFLFKSALEQAQAWNMPFHGAIEYAHGKVKERKTAAVASPPARPNQEATKHVAEPSRPATSDAGAMEMRPGEDLRTAALRLCKQYQVALHE